MLSEIAMPAATCEHAQKREGLRHNFFHDIRDRQQANHESKCVPDARDQIEYDRHHTHHMQHGIAEKRG